MPSHQAHLSDEAARLRSRVLHLPSGHTSGPSRPWRGERGLLARCSACAGTTSTTTATTTGSRSMSSRSPRSPRFRSRACIRSRSRLTLWRPRPAGRSRDRMTPGRDASTEVASPSEGASARDPPRRLRPPRQSASTGPESRPPLESLDRSGRRQGCVARLPHRHETPSSASIAAAGTSISGNGVGADRERMRVATRAAPSGSLATSRGVRLLNMGRGSSIQAM